MDQWRNMKHTTSSGSLEERTPWVEESAPLFSPSCYKEYLLLVRYNVIQSIIFSIKYFNCQFLSYFVNEESRKMT